MEREFSPEYGSHRVFIKSINREIEFCNGCGEYICPDGLCSNPMCPEPIPDLDPELEAKINKAVVQLKSKSHLDKTPLPNYVIK